MTLLAGLLEVLVTFLKSVNLVFAATTVVIRGIVFDAIAFYATDVPTVPLRTLILYCTSNAIPSTVGRVFTPYETSISLYGIIN